MNHMDSVLILCSEFDKSTSRLETQADGDSISGHARRNWTGSGRQTLDKLLNVSVQSVWLSLMKKATFRALGKLTTSFFTG